MDTNVLGVLRITQAVVPSMAAQRSGLIVNIGSVTAWLTTPYSGAYSASKAALSTLSAALALELRPLGVGVTYVVAGAVRSRLAHNSLGWVDLSRYEAQGSLYRLVADAIRCGTGCRGHTGRCAAWCRVLSGAV
jgi:short-subunit dehydrogenase